MVRTLPLLLLLAPKIEALPSTLCPSLHVVVSFSFLHHFMCCLSLSDVWVRQAETTLFHGQQYGFRCSLVVWLTVWDFFFIVRSKLYKSGLRWRGHNRQGDLTERGGRGRRKKQVTIARGKGIEIQCSHKSNTATILTSFKTKLSFQTITFAIHLSIFLSFTSLFKHSNKHQITLLPRSSTPHFHSHVSNKQNT